jgi:prevent-host-death family protein
VKPSRTFNIHEAKTNFSKLLERVATGEEILIARAGKPVARVVRVEREAVRQLGADSGRGSIADDFDAPLSGDVLAGFAGR